MTTACAARHDVYREKTDKQGGVAAARCTKYPEQSGQSRPGSLRG
jgi:hypothetical protein